jgi:hypothetical protein
VTEEEKVVATIEGKQVEFTLYRVPFRPFRFTPPTRWHRIKRAVRDRVNLLLHPPRKIPPRRFTGPCDICGETIDITLDYADGIYDTGFEDGKVVTWVRHYATAPEGANPDCAKYSSTVYKAS